MMIPLNALPEDVLELIRRYYLASRRADEERHAEHHARTYLQARLRRHLTQRCDDPAHAGFVTYAREKVPCYFATHAHPQRLECRASRREYFARIGEIDDDDVY